MAGKSTTGGRKSGKRVERAAPKTKSSRCDLIFPVGRTHRLYKQARYADNVGVGAGIFTAAVLEYIASEILELAGEHCTQSGKKTISPRHIQLAVRNDEEINKLMAQAMIASGGVLPNISEILFPAKEKGKKKTVEATQEM